MVQIKIFVQQGQIKFTPKFTHEEIQRIRKQITQPIKHLQLFNIVNTLELKNYPREIDDEHELENEFDYIIGLMKKAKSRVRFSGEILGYRYYSDNKNFKKCRWHIRPDDKGFVYE